MKELMLGNEAIARGAYEAGVKVISSYPGTPSTEITEYAASYGDMLCEWAPNEKVAAEVTFGAAMAGARSMTCMKHVGVNVAADPIFTASYTGIRGGMVIVCADDPAMHSSQNEQDSRYYARAAHIPMLEPSDSQECKDFMKKAFEISEKYDTPVFFRITTRIAHARSIVKLGMREEVGVKDYAKDTMKYVMMPGMAKKRHLVVEEMMNTLGDDANTMDINQVEMSDTSLGIICSGAAYQYVKEALPKASVLKLGLVHPLPKGLIADFTKKVDRLVVIEELEGIFEEQIAAMGIKVEGKKLTGYQGELSALKVAGIFGEKAEVLETQPLPPRPPVLCPGCPHRGTFHALNKLKLHVMGDIGCYTMGALAPLAAMDACLCMGASIGMAFGAEKARGKDFSKQTVAVIGDSTFIHSGITALIDAVYNNASITVLILDNRITGMTGHQQNPVSGKNIYGEPAPEIDLKTLCKACGVEYIQEADPFDQKEMHKILKEETQRDAVSVIIAKRPCVLITKEKLPPMEVSNCKNCGMCMQIGCPCISKNEKGISIDKTLCVGCGLCARVCPFGAIAAGGEQKEGNK